MCKNKIKSCKYFFINPHYNGSAKGSTPQVLGRGIPPPVRKGRDDYVEILSLIHIFCFDQYGDLPNIATIAVKVEDMEVID